MLEQSIEKMKELREWPSDGLPELQRLMIDSWPYFDSLVSLSCYQQISQHRYCWALSYALASLWIFQVNARSKAIEKLTMKDLEEMETNDFHLSSQFKTSTTYKYQIVASTDIVRLFVKYIRSYVIPANVDSEEAIVFCTSNGTPLAQGEISKKIGNLFLRYGYRLNVTKLRSILATEIEDAAERGEINPEGLSCNQYHISCNNYIEHHLIITSGQNHSVSTHRKYYLKKKRKYEEGEEINNIFERIYGENGPPVEEGKYNSLASQLAGAEVQDFEELESRIISSSRIPSPLPLPVLSTSSITASSSSTPLPSPSPFVRPLEHVQSILRAQALSRPDILPTKEFEFGIARSDFQKIARRFEWTREEIEHLMFYIKNIEPSLSECELKQKHSSCLRYLREADSSIQKDFHPYHVENSGRIKTGYEMASRKLRIERWGESSSD